MFNVPSPHEKKISLASGSNPAKSTPAPIGMLVITHDLGVARLVSDRIYVMKDGAFVENGGAEELVRRPQSAYTKKLLAAVPVLGPWSAGETKAGVRA